MSPEEIKNHLDSHFNAIVEGKLTSYHMNCATIKNYYQIFQYLNTQNHLFQVEHRPSRIALRQNVWFYSLDPSVREQNLPPEIIFHSLADKHLWEGVEELRAEVMRLTQLVDVVIAKLANV